MGEDTGENCGAGVVAVFDVATETGDDALDLGFRVFRVFPPEPGGRMGMCGCPGIL
jgi:hypothetical protein